MYTTYTYMQNEHFKLVYSACAHIHARTRTIFRTIIILIIYNHLYFYIFIFLYFYTFILLYFHIFILLCFYTFISLYFYIFIFLYDNHLYFLKYVLMAYIIIPRFTSIHIRNIPSRVTTFGNDMYIFSPRRLRKAASMSLIIYLQ